MITWNSKLSEWIAVINSLGACNDMVNFGVFVVQSLSDEIAKNRSDGQEPTIGEVFELFKQQDVIDFDYLILWVTCNMGSEVQVEENVREETLKLVKDPRMALKIYYKSPYLTDREDEILRGKFMVDGRHLYPQIAEELARGTTIRAKQWSEAIGLGELSELGPYVRSLNPGSNPLEDDEINI